VILRDVFREKAVKKAIKGRKPADVAECFVCLPVYFRGNADRQEVCKGEGEENKTGRRQVLLPAAVWLFF
jgi:hypothetical protein